MDTVSTGGGMMTKTERLVLIMAGGAGTRFWPASREAKPKQFLDILGTGKSLLRQTFERCLKITSAGHIYILTNRDYVVQVLEELPELTNDQVFAEPSRNNNAPALAYASLKLQKRYPDAVCLIAPSDHLILDEAEFVRLVEKGMGYAVAREVLLTLGITPSRADTGYGYIRYDSQHGDNGVFPVLQFTEKPDPDTAARFLASGDYLWNSGMFIWTIAAILKAFTEHAPRIADILRKGIPEYFTENEEAFLADHYPKTEKISIDYAILEHAKNVVVIPADFGWSDLGTWTALYEHLPSDPNGNIIVNKPIVVDNCEGSLLYTRDDRLVVVSGLQGFVVINEPDALLIFPKEQEQEVKRLREELALRGLKKFL